MLLRRSLIKQWEMWLILKRCDYLITPDNPTEFITRLPEKGVCNVTFVMKNDDEISALYNSSHDLGTTEALFGIIYYALGKCQCVRVCENMRRLICAD